MSVYRDAVPLEALTEQGLDIDVLDSLVETGLARQADSDVYDVHDLIREFLLQNLDAQTKSNYIKNAFFGMKSNQQNPRFDRKNLPFNSL